MISCCCNARASMGPYNAGDDPEDTKRGWRCTKCNCACEVRLEDFDIGPDPVTLLDHLRSKPTGPDFHLGGEHDD